ncbi:MAG: type VI secretion system Vgr family protein [Methylocella sp.]
MHELSQDARIGELTTPLGKDVLCLRDFSAIEGLGENFEFYVSAVSEQDNIDFDAALGKSCTVRLTSYKGKKRFFDGILTQAEWVEKKEDLYLYKLLLRPWFWLLGQRADCRIFLYKNAKDIMEEVFTKAGFSDFEFKTTADYDTIPYCVQYRESDLAFCLRLMEQYGIYYFFEHSHGKHTMILADSHSSHEPNLQAPILEYLSLSEGALDRDQHLSAWVSERRCRTGKVEFNDYDYLNPKKKLLAPNEANEKYTQSKLEVYDYPGKYNEESIGKKFSKFRLEAEQCYDHRRYVDGDAVSLFPGSLVTVEKHPISSENQEYLVVRCSHRFGAQHYRSERRTGDHEAYRGFYEFLPADRPFRMLPKTPKPRIYGIQTAIVVCKKGQESEEINTDEHGRVWVQFPWDRDKQNSCPVRVAQRWAGQRWGEIFLPRVGMEVVVEYLEGDPDYPLVVGCVYNGDNKVPYDLPSNKTIAGWKTRSSKGGNGYNELIFEDKKGSEQIRIHAQDALNVTVLGSETRTIGGDLTTTVGGPTGGGNVTLNAFQTITLNVGPSGAPPLTQIVMDTTSITLSVGPGGILAQIKLDPSGVTISGTPASQLMVEPYGISTSTPMMTLAYGPVTFVSPMVTIPMLTGMTPAGLPII